jgi:hypothetical protein
MRFTIERQEQFRGNIEVKWELIHAQKLPMGVFGILFKGAGLFGPTTASPLLTATNETVAWDRLVLLAIYAGRVVYAGRENSAK